MTGIRPEHLRDAMPLKQVQRKIQDYLYNGEPAWHIRSRGGKARILVGHGLDHDLKCLEMEYSTAVTRQALSQKSYIGFQFSVRNVRAANILRHPALELDCQ